MKNDKTTTGVPEDTGDGSVSSLAKGRKAFGKVTRELTDEDLKSPAVQRVLLDEVERLENENSNLRSYRRKFYEADSRVSVLEEKCRSILAIEVLTGICLTIGAALLGYAPVLWTSPPSGLILLVVGALLVVGGGIGRFLKK